MISRDLAELLDEELREVFLQLPVLDAPTLDPPAFRARVAELIVELAGTRVPDERVRFTDRVVTGSGGDRPVPVRVYEPVERRGRLPAILFVHGGGFVLDGLDPTDSQCEQLAASLGSVVVSVDYRVAPEDPFPAALDDCYAALSWLSGSGPDIDVDSARIAIVGESAGAGIAAGVALLARDRGEISPAFQMLLWACLDDRHETQSSHAITDRRVWNREYAIGCWQAYLGGEAGAEVSPYAAPARATELAGLPPTYLSVGQLDLLLDENIDYARRLMRAGVETELHVYPGAFHGFEVLAPTAAVSIDSRTDQYRALARALDPSRGAIT